MYSQQTAVQNNMKDVNFHTRWLARIARLILFVIYHMFMNLNKAYDNVSV